MNLMNWQSWPLGPIPICFTLWGIYWIIRISMQPKRSWLAYSSSNNLAVYSVAATISVGLAYTFRYLTKLPPYLFHINWLPIVATVLTVTIAEIIDRLLKLRFGYEPVAERYRLWWRKFLSSNSPQIITKRKRNMLFAPTAFLGLAIIQKDTSNGDETNILLYSLETLLGNIHMQTGVMWGLSVATAMIARSAVVLFMSSRSKK